MACDNIFYNIFGIDCCASYVIESEKHIHSIFAINIIINQDPLPCAFTRRIFRVNQEQTLHKSYQGTVYSRQHFKIKQ